MLRKRIVIAGLGDAGLLSAIQLNKKFEVIGISPKPCLVSGQELGPRLARPKDWEEYYLIDYDRFKGLKGVHIRHAKVSEIIADENKNKTSNFLLENFLKKGEVANRKNKKKENFWRNPPAISSSPNGPPNLRPFPSNPKISFPKLY